MSVVKNVISAYLWLSIHTLNGSFSWAEVLGLMHSNLSIICLTVSAFFCHFRTYFTKQMSWSYSPLFIHFSLHCKDNFIVSLLSIYICKPVCSFTLFHFIGLLFYPRKLISYLFYMCLYHWVLTNRFIVYILMSTRINLFIFFFYSRSWLFLKISTFIWILQQFI